jgi:hypothetical protein
MNKNKLISGFLFILCCSLNLSGQTTFFNFVEGWVNSYSVEDSNGYLLLGLKDLGGGSTSHSLLYNQISLNGNFLDSWELNIDSVETTTTDLGSQIAIEIENELLIVSYFGNPSDGSANGGVFSYGIGSGLWDNLFTIDNELFTSLFCIEVSSDNMLLLAGFNQDVDFNVDLHLYKTNLEGLFLWEFISECGQSCRSYPQQILPLDNGNTVLLFREWDLSYPFYHDRERAVLVMIDPEGEELWRVYPGNYEDYKIIPGGVLEVDGELLVSFTDPRYYDDNGEWLTNWEGTLFFERYSISGDLLDDFDFSGMIPNGSAPGFPELGYQITQMQSLDDGNILVSGHTFFKGFLLKMTPEGTIIWFRIFTARPFPEDIPEFYQYTHFHHTLPTSDGGYLCTGEYLSDPTSEYPNGIQTAIALKVDEYGCLEAGCEVTGIEDLHIEKDEGLLNIFPNPAQSHFTLEYEIDRPFHRAEMIVSNVLGQTEFTRSLTRSQDQLIVQDALQPGVYLVSIRVDSEVYKSVQLIITE